MTPGWWRGDQWDLEEDIGEGEFGAGGGGRDCDSECDATAEVKRDGAIVYKFRAHGVFRAI